MLDLGFAGFLAVIALGAGARILGWLRQSPDEVLDEMACALPLGLGCLALGVFGLGELRCLNPVGLAVLIAIFVKLGLGCGLRLMRNLYFRSSVLPEWGATELPGRVIACCLALALLGTSLVAIGPVTGGDALCYHLQVPKAFLMKGAVGFDPDLHETIYPLVTELLYTVALALRGPVACRWIQFALGLVLALNVSALARPVLGRRAWWAGAIVVLTPAVSNGMSAPLNDVSLAAFGTAALHAWSRLMDHPTREAALVAGILGGLAIGVKYPALVFCALLAGAIACRPVAPRPLGHPVAPRAWLGLAAVYVVAVVAVGGSWYL